MDNIKQTEKRSKEQDTAKDNEEEENHTKRRRSDKPKPNLEVARRRLLNANSMKTRNKFDLLEVRGRDGLKKIQLFLFIHFMLLKFATFNGRGLTDLKNN